MWLVEALGYKLKTPKKNWFFTASEADTSLDLTCFFASPIFQQQIVWPCSDPVSPRTAKNQKKKTKTRRQLFHRIFLGAWGATIGRRLTKKGILVRSPAFLILDVEIIGGVRRQDKGCLVVVGPGGGRCCFFYPNKMGQKLDDYLWFARICASCLEQATQIVGFEVNVS